MKQIDLIPISENKNPIFLEYIKIKFKKNNNIRNKNINI
jgi:hypothetical protein